jgi:hypothetical protein
MEWHGMAGQALTNPPNRTFQLNKKKTSLHTQAEGVFDMYVDFEGARGEERVDALMRALDRQCNSMLVLDKREVRGLSLSSAQSVKSVLGGGDLRRAHTHALCCKNPHTPPPLTTHTYTAGAVVPPPRAAARRHRQPRARRRHGPHSRPPGLLGPGLPPAPRGCVREWVGGWVMILLGVAWVGNDFGCFEGWDALVRCGVV